MALALKNMNIPFIKYRKLYYFLSFILVSSSIAFLFVFGLKPGIDFTGGSLIEIQFSQAVPENAIIENKLADLDLGQITFQPIGEKGLLLRLKHIDEETHQEILSRIGDAQEQRFETIGPLVGKELEKKTRTAIILSLLAIIAYIAFAFRKISYPIKSWQFGIAALVALFHDIVIPLGVFSLLGKLYGVEMTIPLVAALLTVLGYSISDTVVVFDRIRENLLKREKKASFDEIVNTSLNQTLVRSASTGLSVFFTLFAIYFFGGDSLKYFSLILIIGIICGTYSSIFIASPLIVSWVKWKNRRLTNT
ncbi:MAG: protein translocase subunit SecF [bacterium]